MTRARDASMISIGGHRTAPIQMNTMKLIFFCQFEMFVQNDSTVPLFWYLKKKLLVGF